MHAQKHKKRIEKNKWKQIPLLCTLKDFGFIEFSKSDKPAQFAKFHNFNEHKVIIAIS